jgi:hypothetical protein
MWDLWWTNWHWGRCFSHYFSIVSIMPPLLHDHSVICLWRYTISAVWQPSLNNTQEKEQKRGSFRETTFVLDVWAYQEEISSEETGQAWHNLKLHLRCCALCLSVYTSLFHVGYLPYYLGFKTHLFHIFLTRTIRVHLTFDVVFFTLWKPRTRQFSRRTSGLAKRVVKHMGSEMYFTFMVPYITNLFYESPTRCRMRLN